MPSAGRNACEFRTFSPTRHQRLLAQWASECGNARFAAPLSQVHRGGDRRDTCEHDASGEGVADLAEQFPRPRGAGEGVITWKPLHVPFILFLAYNGREVALLCRYQEFLPDQMRTVVARMAHQSMAEPSSA